MVAREIQEPRTVAEDSDFGSSGVIPISHHRHIPGLAEADVMRRVLAPNEFAKWLTDFLPQLPNKSNSDWLPIVVSPDPSDPKLAHLDGLNLSRAWMLEGILSGLPKDDPRRDTLQKAAEAHRRAGLAAVTGEHYEGGHWLGSFAVYLVTQRGIEHAR